jgi:hypothetical protein
MQVKFQQKSMVPGLHGNHPSNFHLQPHELQQMIIAKATQRVIHYWIVMKVIIFQLMSMIQKLQ